MAEVDSEAEKIIYKKIKVPVEVPDEKKEP